ncbi:thioredoxin [Pelovirga terrestris]|uniref:Thioredoxin n=1 Tax=Pelovirga terrestris TaxID=2771352 RepID=A0A8J6UQV6_9BACT|nr:thioredoxin [Pelovirga terrestris]MBD1399736.1 thioredoxin [Pelovirga terrestris]
MPLFQHRRLIHTTGLVVAIALLFGIVAQANAFIDCAPGQKLNPLTMRCEAAPDCPDDVDASTDAACQGVTASPLIPALTTESFGWGNDQNPALTSSSKAAYEILYFWGIGCPFCERLRPQLEQLAADYPQVQLRDFEVYYDRANQQRFLEATSKYGIDSHSVPLTLIGERYWIGYREHFPDEMRGELEKLLGLQSGAEAAPTTAADTISVPLFGDINVGTMPLLLTTVLIAFVDGFNPCSLWLLTILLGILLHTRSRRKIIVVGLAFLLTTAAGYGAFMLGLLNVFLYVGYVVWIKIVVGLLALTFAVVNIKDYFWFQQGVSFTISDKHKPGIFKRMRNIIHQDMSTAGMVGATIIMALGVTLVELPCTAGFPVIWSNIAAQQGVTGIEFALLFVIYLTIYLGVEIAILATAVITLKKSVFEEKHGRILKLISGVIMLVLAYGIVFAYDTLGSLGGVLGLFGAAAVIIAIVLILHRIILPRCGISIGSEKQKPPSHK